MKPPVFTAVAGTVGGAVSALCNNGEVKSALWAFLAAVGTGLLHAGINFLVAKYGGNSKSKGGE